MKKLLLLLLLILVPAAQAANTLAGNLTIQGKVYVQGDLTPAIITSNQNDYAPTGFATTDPANGVSVLRLSSDASRDITGIVPGASPDGRMIYLLNVGSFNIVFKDASGSSLAANRFALGADFTLFPGAGVQLYYDLTSTAWRKMAGPDASALYEPIITAGTTAQYWRGDKSWQTLNQAAVAGLTTADSPVFAGLSTTPLNASNLSSGTVDNARLDADLASIAANTTGGFLTRTAANTYAARTVTGTAGQITVTNGDGVSGAPTISLPSTITQATTFTGVVTATGAGTIGGVFYGAGQTNNVSLGTSGANQPFIQGYNSAFSTGQTLGINTSAGGNVSVGNSATVTAINGTTQSTTTTTGALTVAGGVGIAAQIVGGSNLDINNNAIVGVRSASSGGGGQVRFRDDTATIRWLNGLLGTVANTTYSIYDAVNSVSVFTVTSGPLSTATTSVLGTQAATSTTTGALRVAGGLGVAGAQFLGGNLTFGTSGSVLNGTTGSIGLTATGTNQGISLTPSGTGQVFASSGITAGGSVNTTSSGGIQVKYGLITATPTNSTDAFVGVHNTGGPGVTAGEILIIPRSTSGISAGTKIFGNSSGTLIPAGMFTAAGRLLVGTHTDAATGYIQIPASTNSADGISFGGDTIYRSAAGTLTTISTLGTRNIVNQFLSGTVGIKSLITGVAGTPEALRLESSANQAADRGIQQSFYIPSGTSREGVRFVAANTAGAGSGGYLGVWTESTGGTMTEAARFTATQSLEVKGTVASTSTTTGALTVAGGFSAQGAGFIGGTLTRTGASTSSVLNIIAENTSVDAGSATNGGVEFRLQGTGSGFLGAMTAYGDDYTADANLTGKVVISTSSNLANGLQLRVAGTNVMQLNNSGTVSVTTTTEATTGGAGSLTTAGGIYAAKKIISNSDVVANGVVVHKAYTVATLPAAASYTYGTAFVSDATNAAGTGAGTTPTGGGAVKRMVYSDGTNWLLL